MKKTVGTEGIWSRRMAIGLVVALLAAGWVSDAEACNACNLVFTDEIRSSRAGSLLARDLQRAAENQRGLPLNGFSSMPMNADARVETKPEPIQLAAVAEPSEQSAPVRAANPSPRNSPSEVPDWMANAAFPDIVARDYALPTPLTSYVPQDAPVDKSFTITLHEGQTYIGNGVLYDGFLIDGKVPGPTLIVDEGDIVEITVVNDGMVPHGASIHAAYTQSSAYLGSIQAGETKSLRFKASYPGVFMYHCAPGGHAIPMHVLGGQYGMIVVKPKGEARYQLEKDMGQQPDLELYMIQHELYASGKDAVEGNATYTMFNGRLFRYVEEPIHVQPGDYVRMYFLNVGPNLLSTFHIVGIIWDYVYWQGHPDAKWPGGQSVTAGPTDSWVIEFRIPPEEGAYTMLSHAVGSTSRGAIGLLVASADADTPPVVLADGPEFTDEEMAENREKAMRTIAPFAIGTHPVDRPVVFGPDTEEVLISIIGNSYWPKVVQVEPGTKITWVNEDVFTYLAGEYSGIHNAAATITPPGADGFVTPLLAHGEKYSVTLETEGGYQYICTPHPYMEGKVIVKASVVVEEEPERAGAGGLVWTVLGLALLLSVIAVLRSGKK